MGFAKVVLVRTQTEEILTFTRVNFVYIILYCLRLTVIIDNLQFSWKTRQLENGLLVEIGVSSFSDASSPLVMGPSKHS